MQKNSGVSLLVALTLLGLGWGGPAAKALSLSDLPAPVRKTIEAQAQGKTVGAIQRTEDDGQASYQVETDSKDGGKWNMTVAGDGTLQSIDLSPEEVPSAIRKTINQRLGQGRLQGVEKDFDDGETTYLAGITAPDGQEHDLTFAENGTLQSEDLELKDLSPDLQTAVQAQVGNDKLEEISHTRDGENVVYDVSVTTASGQEHNFTLSRNGDLASEEIDPKELPTAVQTALQAQTGGGKAEEIDKTFDDGEVGYDVTVLMPQGRERDYSFAEDGTLESKEVSLDEVPAPVRDAINQKVGGGRLEGIDENFQDEQVGYDVTRIMPSGRERDFTIAADGTLSRLEMSLADVSPAVKATILQAIGNGKLVRIDQVYHGNRRPYKIEARKAGKLVDFTVNRQGRLMGSDD